MTATINFRQFADTVSSPSLRAVAEHWHRVRGGKLMPAWGDLSSSVLSPHFKLLWGFRYDPLTEEFMGTLAGAHVKEWLGANFWGAKLTDIHPTHVANAAHQLMRKVVTTPAAGRCTGELFTMGGQPVTGERIALPVAADGVNGDGVLGALDYDFLPVTGPVELLFENMEWFAL